MAVRALGSVMGLGLLCAHCSSFGAGPRSEGGGTRPWQVSDGLLGPSAQGPQEVQFQERDPLLVVAPQASWQLDGFAPESRLVGVAMDTNFRSDLAGGRAAAAQTYVLEARTGLYQLTPSGPKLVFDRSSSRVVGGEGDGSPPAELTDVAFDEARSLESGRVTFVLTAENAGFELALPDPTLLEFFRYFPRSTALSPQREVPRVTVSQELREQGVPVVERTEAVALDPITSQIVAQPRTLRLDDGSVAGSELFVFGSDGREPVDTFRLARSEFAAGGAAFLFGSLALGSGPDLYLSEGWGQDLVRQVRLDSVEEITGITTQPDGDLLVLDGPHRRLVEVGLEQLQRALESN